MTTEEFVALSREMSARKKAIASAEIQRRITVADLDRIDAGLATDRAFVAQSQARIDAHWNDWQNTAEVTA